MVEVEKDELGLYCQSCCARYPYCIYKEFLGKKDRLAEVCADFLPKDIYKVVNIGSLLRGSESIKDNINKSKSPCYYKRLILEPDFRPLPEKVPIASWKEEALAQAKRYAYEEILREHDIFYDIRNLSPKEIKKYMDDNDLDKELRRIISDYIKIK